MSRKVVWNVLLGILLALTLWFIWGNSLLTREESSGLSIRIYEWLQPALLAMGLDRIDEHFLRKLAHFTEFAVLGCELAALFFLNRGRNLRSVGFSALCALVTAATDETIQLFSGRAAMLRDVLLDFTGALAGIVLFWLLTHRRRRGQEKDQL